MKLDFSSNIVEYVQNNFHVLKLFKYLEITLES